MNRYCLALDLKDDEALIKEYEAYHKKVWPEILQSIKESGIEQMEIYRVGNRLFMIMETNDHFDFEKKARADATDPKVKEWEALMWRFQKPTPWTEPGNKWQPMGQIFSLDEQFKRLHEP